MRRTRQRLKRYGGASKTRKVNWTYKKPTSIPYEKVLGKQGCKPGNEGSTDSCLSLEALNEIAKSKGVSIKPGTRTELCDALKCTSDTDASLMQQLDKDLRQRLQKSFFRPPAPEEWKSDPDAWLDNHSIEAVLKQYSETDPTFVTLGAVPIDFAAPSPYDKGKCLLPEFCKLNINELRSQGKTGVGMVFNLDPHFKNGSHWVALYINIKQPGCYYFDSYGIAPPKQVKLLMDTIWSQDKRCKLGYNGRRFQYSNSECGMYSLFFIICMHYGIPFKYFVKHRVKDDVMLFLRSWLFFM